MQQQPRLPLWFLVANWALIAGAFFWGIHLGSRAETPGKLVATLPQAQLEALAIVHREVLRSHVDPQAADDLLDRAISGMVQGLDPYSRYVPAAEVARYEEANTGHYEGIGADFAVHGDDVVLHFPLVGGPAERAGLRPGDVLLAVDGKVLDATARQRGIAELVRGPAGTDVRLQLRRDGEVLDLTVARGDVQRPCVKWAHWLDGERGLGYVHLTDFHPGSAEQLSAAIRDLQATRALRGLVLDLRWNGGGSLQDCVAIARGFLANGLVVSQQRRNSEVIERYEATPEQCKFPNLSLVLLVNRFSASASEVLAGALQDHGRAAIVGERTHGKAFVNTVYTWPDQPFRLKLTTGKYLTPNGRDIERHHHQDHAANDSGGIPPDVVAAVAETQQEELRAALRAREAPAAYREAFAAVAAKYGVAVDQPPQAARDPQLATALTTLRSRADADQNASENTGSGKSK